MGRLSAGLHLTALVLFWLVAWLPLALYAAAAAMFGALRRPRKAFG